MCISSPAILLLLPQYQRDVVGKGTRRTSDLGLVLGDPARCDTMLLLLTSLALSVQSALVIVSLIFQHPIVLTQHLVVFTQLRVLPDQVLRLLPNLVLNIHLGYHKTIFSPISLALELLRLFQRLNLGVVIIAVVAVVLDLLVVTRRDDRGVHVVLVDLCAPRLQILILVLDISELTSEILIVVSLFIELQRHVGNPLREGYDEAFRCARQIHLGGRRSH
ncbi:hypothetical protein BKA58DRAFT_447694, partial [Alternaria rosae]|uniref:uncharacterized protein n=1 Tax=Alternaria rosae TaxID=1187941 RepID=UPI001E8CD849